MGWRVIRSSLARESGARRPVPSHHRPAEGFGREARVSLPAGLYTCQVNVIDDASRAFRFPRLQLFVKR
jgi:hypothetical protein